MFFETDKNTVQGANKLASCLSVMCRKLMRQFLKYQEQLELGSRVHFKLLLNIIYTLWCSRAFLFLFHTEISVCRQRNPLSFQVFSLCCMLNECPFPNYLVKYIFIPCTWNILPNTLLVQEENSFWILTFAISLMANSLNLNSEYCSFF